MRFIVAGLPFFLIKKGNCVDNNYNMAWQDIGYFHLIQTEVGEETRNGNGPCMLTGDSPLGNIICQEV